MLLLLLITGLAAADDVILKPLKQGAEEVALIMVQGLLIQPDQYIPLAQSVQNASNYSLWVGIPQFDGDMVVPVDPSEGIARILGSMRDGGMSTATTVFFAGHSVGGAALQDYVNSEAKDAPGLILLGSFLRRWYRNETYPVPTMTIGGELDGLARVTRIMEEYYHRVLHSNEEHKKMASAAAFPVVVVEGLSHMQFASGDPPALVKDRDLQPEISYDEAHAIVGSLMASFIAVRLGDDSQQMAIDRALATTWTFVQPLVEAYFEEGFYNFLPPCYDNPPSASCTTGCPWTETAQVIMSGLNESTVMVTDAFHPVSQLFPVYHHPKILNSCTGGDSSDCFLNETSVTENKYDDKADDGTAPTSAEEIRAKMNSRQAVWEAVGMQNVNFEVSDGPSICKYTNEAAYNWTVKSVAPKTLARFQKYGEPLVMGEDKGSYIFPEWALLPLEYTEMKDDAGNSYILVSSPMMKVKTNFVVKLLAGFHFCKLLSPGRVAEWLYVDGLREHYSLANFIH